MKLPSINRRCAFAKRNSYQSSGFALALSFFIGLYSVVAAQTAGNNSSSTLESRVSAGGMQLNVTAQPIASIASTDTPIEFELKFQLKAQERRVVQALGDKATLVKVGGVVLNSERVSLISGSKESAQVIVALDTSGSMILQDSVWSTTKLNAAKSGLTHFLSSMQLGDSVELLTFDKKVRSLYPRQLNEQELLVGNHKLGENLQLAVRAVDEINIVNNGGDSALTSLYDAIETGLVRANTVGAPNLLVITDGMEDSVKQRKPRAGATECTDVNGKYQSYVKARESQLIEKAGFVRIFTVAIGDASSKPCADGWADAESMGRLAAATSGGSGERIRLQDLKTDATGKPTKDALQEIFKSTLERVRESFNHDYVLRFKVDRSEFIANVARPIRIEVQAKSPDGKNVVLPLEFSWTLSGGGAESPVLNPSNGAAQNATGPGTVKTTTGFSKLIPRLAYEVSLSAKEPQLMIATAPVAGGEVAEMPVAQPPFVKILLLGLSCLGLLATIPKAIKKVEKRKAEKFADAVVARLNKGSPYIGKCCPNERRTGGLSNKDNFKAGDLAVVCPEPSCRTPHHIACWAIGEAHKCWVCRKHVKLSAATMVKIDE
jgi:von Willebrand factor type A domain